MPVYVDNAQHRYRRMIMCHMLADSLEELHAMADRIGVARRHFQNHGTPHYDICKSKRVLAVRYGAIELTSRQELVAAMRRARAPVPQR